MSIGLSDKEKGALFEAAGPTSVYSWHSPMEVGIDFLNIFLLDTTPPCVYVPFLFGLCAVSIDTWRRTLTQLSWFTRASLLQIGIFIIENIYIFYGDAEQSR